VIRNDSSVDQIVAKVRSNYLATRPRAFDRLDFTILIEQDDGTWLQSSYNPYNLAYPASCVKLAYMASAVHFCHENGLKYDCLDAHVRPMIGVSDNLQTGVVVDSITGAPNIINMTSYGSQFDQWYHKRLYTHRFLDSHGLLGNQSIYQKTYPSNSGQSPNGAESLALQRYGKNQMCPQCAAYLILEVVSGRLIRDERSVEYMSDLLVHFAWTGYTSFGFGLPPGTIMKTKIGDAYDTVEEIAYVTLPNGKRFVLAAFSNGLELEQPYPYDCSGLGVFAEMLTDALGLNEGNPEKIVATKPGPMQGKWTPAKDLPDKYGDMYYVNSDGGSFSFQANLQGGLYEVVVWSPQSKNFSKATSVTVNHSDGVSTQTLDQTHYGGRWYKLGDFRFDAGLHNQIVTIQNNGGTSVANAVKLTRWPECNGVPGAICSTN
jgi:hypothetical protein